MAQNGNSEALGIYVSVPFCRAKCSFCNFASGVSTEAEIDRYVTHLCKEIEASTALAEKLRAELTPDVDTIYFGGGTPSLLQPAQLHAVFTALKENFDVRAEAEITLEAAPGQIDGALLEEAMRQGVNRISLGVQSFVDRECAAVGRTHTGKDCLREIARLRRAGVLDIGVDLIAGLPYQTEKSWEQSLADVSEAGVTHVSVYMLEVDEDSRLGREVLTGGLRLHAPKVPDDDLIAQLYERACEELPKHGFEQYEISNFAQPGFHSRHNRKYWERAPYLGFGLDAHSMLRYGGEAVRFANTDNLREYTGAASHDDVRRTSTREAFEENVFLGLRLVEGIDSAELRQVFPAEWVDATFDAAAALCAEGLMRWNGGRWQLTPRGRLLSNEVFGHLLETVPA